MSDKQTAVTDYEKPQVVDYGDLLDLTAAMTTGGALDATFPTNTPFSQLTFSLHH